WGAITQTERSLSSVFHSLQAKFERRFSVGLTAVSAYTWSHSIDTGGPVGTGGGNIQNNYDLRAERGNSPFDVRHRLVNSYSYELPIGADRRFLSGATGLVSRHVREVGHRDLPRDRNDQLGPHINEEHHIWRKTQSAIHG